MTDKNAAVGAIVRGAIKDLVALGMEPEGAAKLLAVQGIIRIPSDEGRRELLHLVDPENYEDPAAIGGPLDG